jgi:P4 family phage/plasmid primase-like protien
MVEVNAEAIPEELKDREQWLMWDSSNDTPRQPHWRGNFGISWSNPDDWHTFEEAYTAAQERESWGVGYVMALENDSHPRGMYGCIDIDGGQREAFEEKPKDWVPSIQQFIDDGAYIEFSPSGTGLHIPFVGHEPPEWWSDCQLDEHEGVDVLTNKFCTFTGDTLSVSGDGVTDVNPASFLFEAHEAIKGEAPTVSPSRDAQTEERDYDGEEFLEDADIEDALSHIDADVSYPEWRDIGFAVHDYDSGSRGKSLFESWSKSGTKWDGKSEQYINAIWESADKGNGVTLGTLIHKARQNGWEMPSPGGSTPSVPSAGSPKIRWEDVREQFRNSDVPDKRARRSAAIALMDRHEFLYIDTEDRLLKYHEPAGVFEPGGGRDAKRILVRELGTEFSTHDRNEVLATIQDMTAADVETLNAEEDERKLLCLKNGVLDLDTKDLLDHSPEFRFTRSLPVEYDPDAEAPNAEAFLESITSTVGEKKTLEEMIGAALHPEYLKSKFLFLFGEGRNGKGVYFELLGELLGRENVEGRGLHELANERFAKADLHEKLANVGGDIDDRKLKNVGELKRLTSGTDPVTAERKYGQPFKFVNSATLFFAANEPPAIEDKKRSMARRIVPIHMATEFVENPDPNDPRQQQAIDEEELLGQMTTDDELSGLLNLALDGMDRLIQNGDVSLERGPMDRLEHYQRFSDPIYRFATECLSKEAGSQVEKADVYELYKAFSREEGHAVRHNSVFWREFKRVFHYEETQPRVDGKKGPRMLVETQFDPETFARYATPELKTKYDNITSAGETADSDAGVLESPGKGFANVTVTVAEMLEPPEWLQGKGHLVDDAGNIVPYKCEGTDPLGEEGVESGDEVRLRNVKFRETSEGMTAVLSAVTDVEVTTRPSQQTGLETQETAVDGGESSADSSDDESDTEPSGPGTSESEDTEDKGPQWRAERVVRVLASATRPLAEGAICSRLSSRYDISPEDGKAAIEKALMSGSIVEKGGGEYRIA